MTEPLVLTYCPLLDLYLKNRAITKANIPPLEVNQEALEAAAKDLNAGTVLVKHPDHIIGVSYCIFLKYGACQALKSSETGIHPSCRYPLSSGGTTNKWEA